MRLFLVVYILGVIITAVAGSIYATAHLIRRGRSANTDTRIDGVLAGLLAAVFWPVSVPFFALLRSVRRTLEDKKNNDRRLPGGGV